MRRSLGAGWLRRAGCALMAAVLMAGFLLPGAASAAQPGSADCPVGPAPFGAPECIGYFSHLNLYRLPAGIDINSVIVNGGQSLLGVANANDFINLMTFLVTGAGGGGNDEIGAAFIIETMLGHQTGDPRFGTQNRGIQAARSDLAAWVALVRSYDAAGQVNWNQVETFLPPFQNSAVSNQVTNDDMFYMKQTAETKPVIVFKDAAGNAIYQLKKDCGNLVATTSGLPVIPPPPPQNFDLTPVTNAAITDASGNPVAGNVAEVGDNVSFTYSVTNSQNGASSNVNCVIFDNVHSGGFSPPPVDNGGSPGSATGCPRTFPAGPGSTQLTVENYTPTAADQGKTICRTLQINPVTSSGGQRSAEVCVAVADEPYVKVFGGDVSAGNGLTNAGGTCATSSASVQSWNGDGGSFSGAGGQYGVFALGDIRNFASAQNSGGSGSPASGLAFANTAASGTKYGGQFGSVPCMPDYAAAVTGASTLTGNTLDLSSLSGHTGAYSASGNLTITGGTANAGDRLQIVAHGNVYITGNVTYGGSWNVAQAPLVEIVADGGNIYIDSAVSRIDGVYVAQPSGTPGTGIIYTCAVPNGGGETAASTGSANFYTTCNTQLTVNGSLVANNIQLLRTHGTLSNATPGEAPGSTAGAEVINYGPALWIAQPAGTGGSPTNYDSITSLPPIL